MNCFGFGLVEARREVLYWARHSFVHPAVWVFVL